MSTKKRKRSRPSLDSPELAALANYIRERKCVLFVGAGLSRAAGLPDWGSLMRTIVDTTKLESATPEAAEELEALFDRGKFIELADQCRELSPGYFHTILREILGITVEPTELHRAIVETPYACIVTTNFDTLLEDAYARHSGRGLPRTPTGTELANQGTLLLDGAFFILKAHGTLQHDESMVFTADDYRRITYDNPAFQTFLSALLLSHAVLFVGYSLNDPNFRLLLDSQLTTFEGEVPSRYAVMAGVGPVESDLMWRTARIRVLSYPAGHHEFVGQVLRTLADRSSVDAMGTRQSRSFARLSGCPPSSRPTSWRFEDAAASSISDSETGPPPNRCPHAAMATMSGGPPRRRCWIGRSSSSLSRPRIRRDDSHRSGHCRDRTDSCPGGPRACAGLARPSIPDNAVLSLDLTPDAEIFPWEWTQIEHEPISQRVALVRRPGISSTARGRPFAGTPLRALVIGDPSAKSGPTIPLPGCP